MCILRNRLKPLVSLSATYFTKICIYKKTFLCECRVYLMLRNAIKLMHIHASLSLSLSTLLNLAFFARLPLLFDLNSFTFLPIAFCFISVNVNHKRLQSRYTCEFLRKTLSRDVTYMSPRVNNSLSAFSFTTFRFFRAYTSNVYV